MSFEFCTMRAHTNLKRSCASIVSKTLMAGLPNIKKIKMRLITISLKMCVSSMDVVQHIKVPIFEASPVKLVCKLHIIGSLFYST